MMRPTQKILGLAVAGFAMALFATPAAADPQSSWVGGFHSTRSCESCHVPHNAHEQTGVTTQVPLWNPAHVDGAGLTGFYTSSTLDADTSGGPDGASKLCLSCHDGTYASVSASHQIGEDKALGPLSGMHPISFVYDAALVALDDELKDPSELPRDVLDGLGKMQCTSCHDIHSTAIQGKSTSVEGVNQHNGHYLRWAWTTGSTNRKAEFCQNCHLK